MLIYLIATALSCWLAWKGERADRKWPWRIASAIPLALVAALRWDVGTDIYHTYLPSFCAMECERLGGGAEVVERIMGPLFDRLSGGSVDTIPKLYANYLRVFYNQEWGFRQLMTFMSWSGLGFRGTIALTSALTGALVFTAIYRQSRSPVLAIYLYVATSGYFLGLNIIRQYVAIGFVLVAVEFIVRRKLLPFLACIGAGMLFHYSVVLLIPCYFICRWSIRPWVGVVLIVAAAVFSLVSQPLAIWLLPYLGLGAYCRYLTHPGRGFETMFFALNLASLVFGGLYWRKGRERSGYFIAWYDLTILGTMVLALSSAIPQTKRINHYFAAVQFLLIPEILSYEAHEVWRRRLTVAVMAAFALETWYAVWMSNKNEALPYSVRPTLTHRDLRTSWYLCRSWWCVDEEDLIPYGIEIPKPTDKR